MPFVPPRLYPILDLKDRGDKELDRVHHLALALARAGVTLLQLRAKDVGSGPFTQLSTSLVTQLNCLGCALIVNDRADVALSSHAAGLHLGDEDLPVDEARRMLGPDAVIGYSTHNPAEVDGASVMAVDYLGFGPLLKSPTKSGPRKARGYEALAQACARTSLPIVAIGGMTLDSAPRAWRAGAAAVAVIGEMERATDPAALVCSYRRAAQAMLPSP